MAVSAVCLQKSFLFLQLTIAWHYPSKLWISFPRVKIILGNFRLKIVNHPTSLNFSYLPNPWNCVWRIFNWTTKLESRGNLIMHRSIQLTFNFVFFKIGQRTEEMRIWKKPSIPLWQILPISVKENRYVSSCLLVTNWL